ncbi:hypothetical protein Ancab_029513 [Ancistrocladus abbreviatus]
MMAGNPNWWWSMHNLQTPPLFPFQYVHGSSSSSSSSLLFNPLGADAQDFPQSWSQLLLGGLASDQGDRFCPPSHFQSKKLETWEHNINQISPPSRVAPVADHIKQEVISQSSKENSLYCNEKQEVQASAAARPSTGKWSHVMPASSPKSCVTTLSSNNILDFSNNSKGQERGQQADPSSECNSTATGGVVKKARVQPFSTPSLKVRKEKLGDRITALHQLVSPFGKTDTASVLLEAIGYIRFLQGQIEALSSPYLGNASAKTLHSGHGERNCLFPDHPGQDYNKDAPRDLRSRGLCLVPISCTPLVGNENGADYWAPSLGGGF